MTPLNRTSHLSILAMPPYQHRDTREDDDPSTTLRRYRASGGAPPPPKRNPKFLSFILKAIIMTLITTLFFLFVGLAAIILLHLCLAGGLVHRRRHHHHHRTTSVASPSNGGLCPCEIKRLPKFKYSVKDAPKGGNPSDCCAVCLDDFRQGQWCRKLVGCGHVFHRNCVDKWLVKARACPVCRSRVWARSGCSSSSIDGQGFDCLWDFGRNNNVRVW